MVFYPKPKFNKTGPKTKFFSELFETFQIT